MTLIATVNANDVTREQIEEAVADTLDRLGVELVPCDWAPDRDTIAEATGWVAEVEVIDLNPARD